jgi:quercetin dioxygenase-like cupin family protein
MSDTIEISPATTLTVRSRSAEMLEMEAAYAPGGSPPPPHHHPAQDEHFEVLEGSMTVRAGGDERRLQAGDTIDIPRGEVHQMWNAGDEPARLLWQTSPAGRTEEWFRALSDLLGRAAAGGDDAPGPEAFGELLASYEDVIRIEV